MVFKLYNIKDKIDVQRILLNLFNHVYSLTPYFFFRKFIEIGHFRAQKSNKIPYKVKKYLR